MHQLQQRLQRHKALGYCKATARHDNQVAQALALDSEAMISTVLAGESLAFVAPRIIESAAKNHHE